MNITKIIDPAFKTGGEGTKSWTLVKVQVGDKEATGFGPVVVGDPVDLTYNDKYNNYQFKVLKQGEIPSIDINEDLKEAKPDERGDAITASMAVKLAYVEFVKCEGQLPASATQWALVEKNAATLIDIINRVKAPKTGLQKAQAQRDKLSDKEEAEAQSFKDEIDELEI